MLCLYLHLDAMWVSRTSVESSGVGSGATLDTSTYAIFGSSNILVKGITFYDSHIFAGSHPQYQNCTFIGKTRLTDRQPTLIERVNYCTCTNCYFMVSEVLKSAFHTDTSLGVFVNCTFNAATSGVEKYLIYGGGPVIMKNCTFNTNAPVRYMQSYSSMFIDNSNIKGPIYIDASTSSGTYIFKGYNNVTNVIMPKTSSFTAPDATVCLVSGSTFSMKNSTAANNVIERCRIVVATLTSDSETTVPDIASITGTATVITATGNTITVSGEGTYLHKDGTTDLTIVS